MYEEQAQRAMSAAQRLLSYRPRSEAELRHRLNRRFPPRVVEEVMERLRELRLLDDAAFARAWTESRVLHHPRSAAVIRRELEQKGVAREVAEEAVTLFQDDESAAYKAALKALRSLHLPPSPDEQTLRRRVGPYLHRRGFSYSVIRHTIERLQQRRKDGEG